MTRSAEFGGQSSGALDQRANERAAFVTPSLLKAAVPSTAVNRQEDAMMSSGQWLATAGYGGDDLPLGRAMRADAGLAITTDPELAAYVQEEVAASIRDEQELVPLREFETNKELVVIRKPPDPDSEIKVERSVQLRESADRAGF
jgi:hypothetical protein